MFLNSNLKKIEWPKVHTPKIRVTHDANRKKIGLLVVTSFSQVMKNICNLIGKTAPIFLVFSIITVHLSMEYEMQEG